MSPIHAFIIKSIRDNLTQSGGKVAETFQDLSDDQLVRMMFSNYRGTRGMRLTKIGLEFMMTSFQCYDVARPMRERLPSSEVLFLDHKAQLPYYLACDRVVVFESNLGMMIALADGEISTLVSNQF